jgi:hypothetical protein
MTRPQGPLVPARSAPGPAGVAARLALFLAVFVATLSALRAIAVAPGGSSIGGRLEDWKTASGEYDTLFVGTSHVLRAFVPARFDEALASAGGSSRSCNFGVQGASLLETRWLLAALLDAEPGIRRVFFEYQWLIPQIDPENAFNPRNVYWHDVDSTRLAVERALHWGAELGDGLAIVERPSERHSVFTLLERGAGGGERAALQHVQHWVTELFTLGRGKDVLKGLAGHRAGRAARAAANDGYLSLEDEVAELARAGSTENSYTARRKRFLERQGEYLLSVDRLDGEESVFGDGEWLDENLVRVDDFELVQSIAREVRSRGVEFVLVILPSQSCNRPFEERLQAELGAPVLRYNVPALYPRLYDVEYRFDSGHLSAEGADYFSRLLARDVAALARNESGEAGRLREEDAQ